MEERFVRSPGPGGQHVNKVSSAVQLKFPVSELPPSARERLLALVPSQVTKDGHLLIVAHRFRARERNRADARERLRALLVKAFERPLPRKKTRVTKGAVRRRLDSKRKRGMLKKLRASRDAD